MNVTKHGVHVTQAHTIKWVQIAGIAVTGFLSGGTGTVAGVSVMKYRVEQLEKITEHQQTEIDAMRAERATENTAIRADIHALDMKIERILGKLDK